MSKKSNSKLGPKEQEIYDNVEKLYTSTKLLYQNKQQIDQNTENLSKLDDAHSNLLFELADIEFNYMLHKEVPGLCVAKVREVHSESADKLLEVCKAHYYRMFEHRVKFKKVDIAKFEEHIEDTKLELIERNRIMVGHNVASKDEVKSCRTRLLQLEVPQTRIDKIVDEGLERDLRLGKLTKPQTIELKSDESFIIGGISES